MDKKKNIEDIYPLSPMQQGLLFHSLYEPKSGVYFNQLSCTLGENLNVSALEQAWQQVVDRHPVLRTAFHWKRREQPFQVVYREVKLPIEHLDWRGVSLEEQPKWLDNFLCSDRERGFNFSQPPLMRLTLIHLENNYQLVWSQHHLIIDGWSSGLVLKEVFDIYNVLDRGQDLPMPRSRPYGDYIAWLGKQDLSRAEAFWRRKLEGFTAPTPFRVDRVLGNPASEEKSHAQQKIQLSPETTTALKSLAGQHQLTLNTLVQGAFALLLSRYSGEEDVVFGATSSGRPGDLAGVESMVGLFINTLPIRVRVTPDELLLPWLKKLQAQQTEARQYEYSPLVEIQAWSDVPRGTPLFESILVFENYPVDPSLLEQTDKLEIREVRSIELTNYPLNAIASVGLQLSLSFEYDRQRFDATTITRMLGHFRTLLEEMVANCDRYLKDLQLLTEAERYQLLVEWNDTQTDYPQDRCIHELFEEQVERCKNSIAVILQDQQLTYQELNARANQLAHHLQTLGVEPEVLVGICVERSLEMVIGLLGILKAGGAYVPLDPAYPKERLAFMLSDSQVSVLLTQQKLVARLPDIGVRVVCLDTDWDAIARESEENLVNRATAQNLAYAIYTSGSTGKPKGVAIQHQSLVNYTKAAIVQYDLEPSDRILQFASISFDAAAEEIFPSLVRGATLMLRTDEMLSSVPTFLEICGNWKLTILDLPTAFWHQIVVDLSAKEANGERGTGNRKSYSLEKTSLVLPESLRLVIIGGERALPERLTVWQQQVDNRVRLVNSYGPTEATIVATICELSKPVAIETSGRELPIGRPVSNVETYILDPDLQPVPVGVPGELYIGGVGVARGYLNRPELTAVAFIPHPFCKEPGARLYKTGDLVRYRTDGNIEYLGRIDKQVKIRGFRIECGEIEAVLSRHPQVQQVIVTAREDIPDNKQLVAYVVLDQSSHLTTEKPALTISELRNFLKENLPSYMIPTAFVFMDALPLTPNGKIDDRALPAPDSSRSARGAICVKPRTPVEEELVKIWAGVLRVEQVSIHDNFFDLGGHSLLVTQLLFQVRETFQVELPLRSLFEMPTIASLAESIELARQTGASTIGIKSTVDLNAEAVLDSTIYPEIPIEHKTEPTCIFLTGATGFVGAFLLDTLLQQTQADIYCLVRSSNLEEGKKKIRDSLESYLLWNESLSSRIIPVVGDLSQSLLGLSEEQFRVMASKVDIIYHNGAWVHHTLPYSILKATNVLGTQEILRLASQIKVKPVHFISTSSVFSAVGYSGVKVIQERDSFNDFQMPSGGYSQSKWVGEKLVSIARDRGLPVCIYRLGRVSGHSETGVFNANDFLYKLIIGCIQLGSVPDRNMIENIVPVDYMSNAIAHLSRQKESLNKVFHLVNPQPLFSTMLIESIRSFGYPLKQIPYEQWQAELIKIAGSLPEHPLYPLVPFFPARNSEENTSNSAVLKFDCQNTLDGLAGTSIVCPPVGDRLLNTYLSYLVRSGYLDALQPNTNPKFSLRASQLTNILNPTQ